ncbi:MAG: hypothetical protein AAFN13_16960 [Bacteroidota bacterium]
MLRLSFLLLFALVLVACDSEETTMPDADLIVGAWTGTSLNVLTEVLGLPITVPVYDVNENGGTLTATFTEGGSFTFDLDVEDGSTFEISGVALPLADFRVTGTYTVNESSEQVTLTLVSTDQGDLSGNGDYDFNGDNRLELSIEDPDLVTELVGLADVSLPDGTIRGGSISLQRGS